MNGQKEQKPYPDWIPERKERMTTSSKEIILFPEKYALCEPALCKVNGISFIMWINQGGNRRSNDQTPISAACWELFYFDFFVVFAVVDLDDFDAGAFEAAAVFLAGAALAAAPRTAAFGCSSATQSGFMTTLAKGPSSPSPRISPTTRSFVAPSSPPRLTGAICCLIPRRSRPRSPLTALPRFLLSPFGSSSEIPKARTSIGCNAS